MVKKRDSKKAAVSVDKKTSDVVVPDVTDIKFYRASEKPYGAFSNLFRREIVFENRTFKTSEHAYQAGKPVDSKVTEWILNAPTPGLLAMAAHGLYTWDIRPDWSKIKYDRMRAVLRAKFTQHDDLRDLLLSTGDSRLVEAGTTDNLVNRTWGEVNGKGKNLLGVMLMELRTELRKEGRKASKPKPAPSSASTKSKSVTNAGSQAVNKEKSKRKKPE